MDYEAKILSYFSSPQVQQDSSTRMGTEASDYLLESALTPLPQYNDTDHVIQSMSKTEGELWKTSSLHLLALGFCLGKSKDTLLRTSYFQPMSTFYILKRWSKKWIIVGPRY